MLVFFQWLCSNKYQRAYGSQMIKGFSNQGTDLINLLFKDRKHPD
jgi:hypothetical protein